MSQSLDRSLTILKHIAKSPASLADLANLLGVHKSTVLRLLQTLESHDFARRTPSGNWTTGFGLVTVAQNSLEHNDIYSVARPILIELSRTFGNTIHLAQYADGGVRYIDKVEGPGAIKMQSRIGANAIIHTSGVGKAVAAWLRPEAKKELLAQVTYQKFTSTTLVTPDDLNRELELTKSRGYAIDDREYEDYINCVAVPILDGNGFSIAAISLTALHALAPLSRLEEAVPRLQEAADEISRNLGWQRG